MGYSDYEKVKELRHAIAAIPWAKQQIAEAEKKKKKCSQELSASRSFVNVPKLNASTRFTYQVKSEYEKEARALDAKATEKAEKRVNFWNSLITALVGILLVLVVLAVLGFIAYLLHIVGKWSWNTSITEIMNEDLTYKTAVGIHLFAFGFALFATVGFFMGLLKLFDDIDVIGTAIGVIGVIFVFLSIRKRNGKNRRKFV